MILRILTKGFLVGGHKTVVLPLGLESIHQLLPEPTSFRDRLMEAP